MPRAKRSEKGLLTPDNCVVTLIDFQPQMLFGVSNFDRQTIINNVAALSKATRVFDVPVVLSTVETKGFSGNMWPQVQAVFPKQVPIERSSMNSWDDKNFVAAVEKSGRKKIVLAGLWTETCVALPTIQAIYDKYEVYVVEDCCGDVSQLAHDNAMKRVIQRWRACPLLQCRRARDCTSGRSGGLLAQQPLGGLRVAENRRQWLIQLVRHGAR